MTLDANIHHTEIASLVIHLAFRILTPLSFLYRRHILRACVSPAELHILKTCAEKGTLNDYEELDPDI